MKTHFIIILSITLLFQSVFSQTTKYNEYNSSKYGYFIEYPPNFNQMNATGKNVDFKVVDKNGYSIVIVVKPGQKEIIQATIDMSNSDWEKRFQMPDAKIVKKIPIWLDGQKGVAIHVKAKNGFESDAKTMYYTNYMFVYKENLYVLTATCDINDLFSMQATFFRTLESFTFPK